MPVFRQKRPVHYASVEIIDQELGRLEKLEVIKKKLTTAHGQLQLYM